MSTTADELPPDNEDESLRAVEEVFFIYLREAVRFLRQGLPQAVRAGYDRPDPDDFARVCEQMLVEIPNAVLLGLVSWANHDKLRFELRKSIGHIRASRARLEQPVKSDE